MLRSSSALFFKIGSAQKVAQKGSPSCLCPIRNAVEEDARKAVRQFHSSKWRLRFARGWKSNLLVRAPKPRYSVRSFFLLHVTSSLSTQWPTTFLAYLLLTFSSEVQPNSTVSAGYDATKHPDCSVSSPTVAALSKLSLTPVSHYAGVPHVSIPRWKIKGKKLRVPIALSYNANGLNVTETAG